MLQLPLSGIKKIESIVNNNKNIISLSQGALKLGGAPTKIKKYLKEILDTDRADYYQSAWGIKELREKLASTINKKYNSRIHSEQIIVTHGCIGALSTLFISLLEPGDEVILPEPTYPAYMTLTQAARCKAVFVSLKTNNSWKLDLEKIKAAKTEKTKLLIFSNPINPIGIVIDKKTIKELADWCEENKIYLIIDEAYADYCFDKKFETSVTLVNQYKYLITTFTFSKNMALSGWRVGYMVIPDYLSQILGKTQDALLNCTSVISQYAALFALDHPEITEQFHKQIKENRDMAIEMLKPLSEKQILTFEKPSGGFYLFFKTKAENSSKLCSEILEKSLVSLVPGNTFGPSGKNYLRLCYARDKEIVKKGINRLLDFFLK